MAGIFSELMNIVFGETDPHYRTTNFSGKKCRKCGEGIYLFKSKLVWDEGSREHRSTEKFYECSRCGHVVSNQWD